MSLIVQSSPITTRRRTAPSRPFAPAWVWIVASSFALPCASVSAQIPGAESFVKPLKTPSDFWEVCDYLIRTGQIKQAVPFLDKFEAAKPDDDTLVHIREEYGHNSILRLLDHKETRANGERLTKLMAEAGRRVATRPERIKAAITALAKSNEERTVALEQLREAGAYAAPALVSALEAEAAAGDARAALIRGMGYLDGSAVPPLMAALESGKSETVSAVAEILGNIGDLRAIPALTITATSGKPEAKAAKDAIGKLTGLSYETQLKPPIRVLDDAAREAFLALPDIPEAPANFWSFDEVGGKLTSKPSTRADVLIALGLKYGRAALKLDPKDYSARLNFLCLALEREPASAAAELASANGELLGQILKRAIAEKRFELAAKTIPFLAKVSSPGIQNSDRLNTLVQALASGDRRVELAAAEAIVGLNPKRPFPGSSRVVPALARFAAMGSAPRAIVIDGNPIRGSQVVGYLKILGYDALLTPTGEAGFRQAADCADVELIVIDPNLVQGSWRLLDILANLRSDDHTSGIPVFIVGPLAIRAVVGPKLESFPNVRYLVSPTESVLFKRQLNDAFAKLRTRPLTNAERTDFAVKASTLLSRIATGAGSPFEGELSIAGPSLTIALNTPATAAQAASALGDLPRVEAQRDLADVALNPAMPGELRVTASGQLVKSIKRFGPLVSSEQERRLVGLIDAEIEPSVRDALVGVADALKRKSTSSGRPVAIRPSALKR